MYTGENEQGLRKIMDLTRLISLVLLSLHCYYYCYKAFEGWGWTTPLTDRLLSNLSHTGLFKTLLRSKVFALLFLCISLMGVTGRKEVKLHFKEAGAYLVLGLVLYFGSIGLFYAHLPLETGAITYMAVNGIGYLLVLSGGTLFSRMLSLKLGNQDVFNREAETFPQEERLLKNKYSINLPARYNLKGKWRRSWVNIINPFRGLLVLGSPGSGKTWFVIREVIRQHLEKGFALFVYDFKWDDLTRFTYQCFLKNQKQFKGSPQFYVLQFDDLERSHRSNPLDPLLLRDLTDAAESARIILLALNREWIRKQGEFFVESAINIVTAVIWFLRKHENGKYCTLPHVIELMQVDYDALFTVLRTQPEIGVLVNPFISAYLHDAMEQLEGQMAAAKISLARLSSPGLYYVLSGNDFTLDINNCSAPKVLCLGNNPQKQQVYGAVLSLYVSRLIRMVNQKGGIPSSLVFDEFPTLFLNNMDTLMATARSNAVATTLSVQDFSQLRKDYGRDGADVILNITGNVITGQVTGDTARQLSERFGRILQNRTSVSVNRMDTSLNQSLQLDAAIPPSRMAALSSGEFVGMVADDPHQTMELKAFHCKLLKERKAGEKKVDLPVVQKVTAEQVQQAYLKIKKDIEAVINEVAAKVNKDPGQTHLRIMKN